MNQLKRMIIVNNLLKYKNYHTSFFILVMFFLNDYAYAGGAQNLSEAEQLFNTGSAYKFIVDEPDYSLACDYFEKSASMGFGSALFNLGECYASGDGRKQNYELALKYFKEAYEKGVVDAHLSFLTIQLESVKNNSDCLATLNEIEKIEKDENINLTYSSFIIGVYWLTGKCGISNKAKAMTSLENASDYNNPMAQALLYLIYHEGLYGFEQSVDKSRKWKTRFEKNPMRNDWSLPFAIAGLYENGWGVEKNQDLADKYLEEVKDSK